MRDCPQCGTMVDGETCPKCRYSEGKGGRGREAFDPDWWRCCDTDGQGNRCSKPGSLFDSTFGKGPWYCRQHYPDFRFRGGARTEPPSGWASVRSSLARPIGAVAAAISIGREPGSDDE